MIIYWLLGINFIYLIILSFLIHKQNSFIQYTNEKSQRAHTNIDKLGGRFYRLLEYLGLKEFEGIIKKEGGQNAAL